MRLPDEAAGELFRASSADTLPELRKLTLWNAGLTPAAARVLAAAGWRLEALDLSGNDDLGAAGVAALVAAPTFALRRLALQDCGLDAASLLTLAGAPWPLEELNLSHNDFSAAAAGPALAALARHVGLRRLNVSFCELSAAGLKALAEAAWPALTHLRVGGGELGFFNGTHALGAAAFAGFPALVALDLSRMELGEAGARLLASRRWTRLRKLSLAGCRLGDDGLAALARGAWPALEVLDLSSNSLHAAALYSVANAPWPLEELDLSANDFQSAAAAPALAALSQLVGLRRLDLANCSLRAAGFKALVEVAWPALTYLCARSAKPDFDGPLALGAAAFAGFPALEELELIGVHLGEAGARLLASRRWARLKKLDVSFTQLGDAGLAALARGVWPALESLDLRWNNLSAPPTLEAARRWAPALETLRAIQG